MPSTLQGKSILVTGAGRGIGEAIARELARHGATVGVADLNSANAESVARAIQDDGGTAVALQADVTQRQQVRDAIAALVQRFGKLDGIVNNAGIAQVRSFMSITEDDWHRVLDVNAMSVLIGIQEAARVMIEQGQGGKIINTASIAGKMGSPRLAHYCASKSAVISLTQSAAKELGKHKINVNAICPGIVATQMWRDIGQDYHKEGWAGSADEAFRTSAAMAVLGRGSVPQDLATVVRFLASSDSDFMTGQALVVDGGIVFS